MDFVKMLQDKHCDCGMVHSCSIKHILIGSDVLPKYIPLLADYQKIFLVADTNTYAVFGKQVEEALGNKVESVLVFERDGILVPNEEAVAEMDAKLTAETQLIVGVGSGVIQDLCKYVSFQAKLPYHIIATAPSMDGYASKGAAMIMENMKITYNAHVPEAIIADSEILKDSPMEMIQSGYGDILGKYSCLNDWKLSRVVNDEYFCQYVYDLTYEMLTKTKDLGPALLERDAEAMATLMEALVGVGIAMAYVGNSRPASGSEHHLSHFFEITGILEDKPYFMHGTDVVYSAVYTQYVREQLLKLDAPEAHELPSRETWEENIRRVYGIAADGVIALQDKMGWYRIDRLPAYQAKWDAIKEVLREVPSSDKLIEYVASVGLDIAEYEKLYGEKKIQDALLYAKDLKDRYSVLWMYYDLMA
jgi:glycerol-1-phosphate dehydrogenase [NAD(P)+]